KLKASVGKTKMTLGDAKYERVDPNAGPLFKGLDPDAAPKPAPAAGVKIAKVVRARRVLGNDGKTLTANFPDRDVCVLVKVENLPAKVMNSGFNLFNDSYLM